MAIRNKHLAIDYRVAVFANDHAIAEILLEIVVDEIVRDAGVRGASAKIVLAAPHVVVGSINFYASTRPITYIVVIDNGAGKLRIDGGFGRGRLRNANRPGIRLTVVGAPVGIRSLETQPGDAHVVSSDSENSGVRLGPDRQFRSEEATTAAASDRHAGRNVKRAQS